LAAGQVGLWVEVHIGLLIAMHAQSAYGTIHQWHSQNTSLDRSARTICCKSNRRVRYVV